MEEAAAQALHEEVMQAKNDLIEEKLKSKKTKKELIGSTTAKMGEVQANLGRDSAQLMDDRVYLGELTRSCEAKANEWDQRKKLRAGELEAITKALTVVESTVQDKAREVGNGGRTMSTGLVAVASNSSSTENPKKMAEVRPLSFVQLPYRPDPERSAVALLLAKTASRVGSAQLSALAQAASSDPFAKVKGMVQDLIDRLKQEEVNDANHQTWCVEETRKATRERQYRLRSLDKLEEHQRELEATRAALEDQITNLKTQLKDSRKALANAQGLRDREAAENSRLLSESSDGKEAVERTISETTESEAAAVREFTVLKRELEAGITAKDEALAAAEGEHASTVDDLSTGMTEIADGQGLLDAAVKSIVELDASCKAGGTDGGDGSALTAEDRESKRAAEIAALEEALCIFGECPNEETPPLEDESKIDPKNELSPSIAAKLGVTGLKEKLGGFLQKP